MLTCVCVHLQPSPFGCVSVTRAETYRQDHPPHHLGALVYALPTAPRHTQPRHFLTLFIFFLHIRTHQHSLHPLQHQHVSLHCLPLCSGICLPVRPRRRLQTSGLLARHQHQHRSASHSRTWLLLLFLLLQPEQEQQQQVVRRLGGGGSSPPYP